RGRARSGGARGPAVVPEPVARAGRGRLTGCARALARPARLGASPRLAAGELKPPVLPLPGGDDVGTVAARGGCGGAVRARMAAALPGEVAPATGGPSSFVRQEVTRMGDDTVDTRLELQAHRESVVAAARELVRAGVVSASLHGNISVRIRTDDVPGTDRLLL